VGGRLRVGVVGAGKISGQYSAMLARLPQLPITAVTDLSPARAAALAEQHPGARVLSFDQLLVADDVDVVLNLTTPAQHAPVGLAAVAAGKHVYGEKPLAVDLTAGAGFASAAADAGVRAACAPDTVLGTGAQTARAAVDAGLIGVPHAATAFMTAPGQERWHMGPYYLTTLIHLLGPVERVIGMSGRSRAERVIGDGPRAGTVFPVRIDTHVSGVLQHASGALTTLLMSFDVWATHLPWIEVYGATGSLSVPDPNYFDGDVTLFTRDAPAWTVLAPSAGYVGGGRGIGLLDLAEAIADDRPHRAAADVALHVLDVMEAVETSARTGESVTVTTTCTRPAAVPGLVLLG
jgi:predicted dehydrogenase